MDKVKILYITYTDMDDRRSGSGVRPAEMLRAFISEGFDVHLVEGQQNRRAERREKVKEALEWLSQNTPDICYVESPSGPIFNSIDIRLLKKVKAAGIPMSIFYRDAYWLFLPDYLKDSPLKRAAVIMLQKRDVRVFRETMDIFYMPSRLCCTEFEKHYSMRNMRALPPGSVYYGQEFGTTHTGIYVGGLSELYGAKTLLEAYGLLHGRGRDYRLIFVCREAEFKDFMGDAEIPEWLELHHVSGREALAPLYAGSDCAFLPHRKMLQTDLAFGIKLFEYLSYGKPVISNDIVEMGGFVRENECGMTFELTAESLADTIEKYYEELDEGERLRLHENALEACRRNTWEERCRTVVSDLLEVKRSSEK